MDERRAAFLDRLALEVIAQAIRDTRRGSQGARRWLLGRGYEWLEMSMGDSIDPDLWRSWVLAGCPEAAQGLRANIHPRSPSSQTISAPLEVPP